MTTQGYPGTAAEIVASLAKGSLVGMIQIVEAMDESEIAGALAKMSFDPEHVIDSMSDSRELNWDAFEAGGPLAPDHVEVRIGPAITGIVDKEDLLALLRRFEPVEGGPVSVTKWPWLYWWRPLGLPACLITLMPLLVGDRGFACIVHIGQTHLSNAFAGQKPEAIQQALKADAARRLDVWVLENKKRPMSDHPGFDIFVQKPAAGLPGLCAVRVPMPPFTPILPLETWAQRYGINVFETVDELAEMERFYQEPGVAFHRTPPLFRNRPSPSLRPAPLAGGILEGQIMMVETPWPDAGCAWSWTLPNVLLNAHTKIREAAHRGRYMVQMSRNLDTAKAEIDKLTHGTVRSNILVVQSTRHPKAALPWRTPEPGLLRHVIIGDALDGRDAYALTVLSRYQDRPAVLTAAADAEEFRSAISAFATTYDCQPADTAEVLSGPNAASIGLIVLDRDAAGFAAAALPDRGEGAETLASVVACVVLHRDETDLPYLAEARTLAARVAAKLLLVLVGGGMQASRDEAFDAAVSQARDEFQENFRVIDMPPPLSIPLAEMATEILSRPPRSIR